jgi:copper homeostasis protein
MAFLEIACFNAESALIANKAGADRIEFCQTPEVGGTTPAYKTLLSIKEQMAIPVFVMIRPRGGDFVYTDTEVQQMRASIEQFKEIADGLVFGILDASSAVDIRRTRELVHLAHPLPCTFHRAFDQTLDPYKALEDIKRCGISTILTSGVASSAVEGRDTLAKLVETAGGRIAIMPGGGVRSTNIERLRRSTKASFYHSSALVDDESVPSSTEIGRLRTSCRDSLNHEEAS